MQGLCGHRKPTLTGGNLNSLAWVHLGEWDQHGAVESITCVYGSKPFPCEGFVSKIMLVSG